MPRNAQCPVVEAIGAVAGTVRRYPLLFIPLYAILSVDYEVGGIADEGRHGS